MMRTVFRFVWLGAVVLLCTAENTAVTREFSNGVTSFSLNLFKKVASQDENKVVSPVSVSTMLALLQQGSGGETETELTRVIHTSTQVSRQGYSELTRNLQQSSENVTLEFANGAFLNSKFHLKTEFKNTAQNDFHSLMENVQFADPMGSAHHINNWVAEHTHNRIQNLIEQEYMDDTISMVLANAIYFKGKWKTAFNKNLTRNSRFFTRPNSSKKVKMMYMEERLKYGDLAHMNAKWLELPFQGGRFSLIIILPNAKFGLNSVINNMTAEDVSSLIRGLKNTVKSQVRLILPRFKMASKLELTDPLKQLGMHKAFRNADFSKMTEKLVSVYKVVHKAEIEVNEEGATASAATGVMMVVYSSSSLPEFIVNHPFMALVIDKKNNIPIFFSRIVRP